MAGHDDIEERTDLLVTMEMDDGIDEEELQIIRDLPPLSSYVTVGQFWCTFSMYPAIFLLLNIVAFVTWLEFDNYHFQYNGNGRNGDDADLLLDMFKANAFANGWILLVDTVVLFQATRFLEKQVTELNSREDSTQNVPSQDANDTSLVHAKVSRKLDKFFGQRQRPVHTSLVCLLYVSTILIGAGCLASFGVSIFAGTTTAKNHCSYRARAKKKKGTEQADIDGIPEELQTWAKTVGRQSRRWGWTRNEKSYTYAHLSDGRTFFTGANPASEKTLKDSMIWVGEDDDSFDGGPPRALTQNLVSVGGKKGSVVQIYPGVVSPYAFTSVSGASIEASESFCCLYRPPNPNQESTDDMFDPYSSRGDRRLLCLSTNEDEANAFRNISLSAPLKGRGNHWTPMGSESKGHEGLFWLAAIWRFQGKFSWDNEYEKFDVISEFYTVDPVSMSLKSIVNVTRHDQSRNRVIHEFGDGGPCIHWIAGVTFGLAMISILPACYWLFKKKKTTIGVVPITLACCFVLEAVSENVANYLAFAAIIATSLLLLRGTKTWRDVILYVHYSNLLSFVVQLLLGDWMSVIFLIMGIVVGIFLNHPVLEVLGWTVGPLLIIFFSTLILLSNDHYYDPDWILESIILFPVAIIISCGLIATGRALRRYRAYISYYGRRLWTSIRRIESSSTTRGESGEMTRRLID